MQPIILAFFRKQMLSGLNSSKGSTFLYCPFVLVVKHVEFKQEISVLERKAPSIHVLLPVEGGLGQVV